MARLGMPVSDTTILHSVKASAKNQPNGAVLRVVGIDEWAWRKGRNFGTVIVDLERRKVVELLADRTATSTADWFKRHPGIEIVSRDRAGLYAEAARQGAPQARQVADRFHLLKNFRETVERQLGRFEAPIRQGALQIEDDPDPPEQPVIERSDGCSEVVAHERQVRRERDASRQAMFDEIRALYDAGNTVTEIARQLGIGPRARLSMGASHRRAGAQSHGAETQHAGLLRGVPGTQLGGRDDQDPASVLRHPSSRLHRIVQSPRPLSLALAQPFRLRRAR
jgi:transposase